jgi:hypothetical protein
MLQLSRAQPSTSTKFQVLYCTAKICETWQIFGRIQPGFKDIIVYAYAFAQMGQQKETPTEEETELLFFLGVHTPKN